MGVIDDKDGFLDYDDYCRGLVSVKEQKTRDEMREWSETAYRRLENIQRIRKERENNLEISK
jgi:hypothetical protein